MGSSGVEETVKIAVSLSAENYDYVRIDKLEPHGD